MKSRDAQGAVLAGLRTLLIDGSVAPGDAVCIVDVAARFGVSATPVREALARLAGEGVLRATRRSGYERAGLDAEDLRQLYAFREGLLVCAADLAHESLDQARRPADEATPTVEDLFDRLMDAAGNAPLIRAYGATALVLRPASLAEAKLFDTVEEGRALVAALQAAPCDFRRALAAHHARRRAAAGRLAELVRIRAGGPPGA